MRKVFFIAVSLLVAFSSSAQKKSKKSKKEENRKRIDAIIKQEEEGVITYKKHSAFGLKLINNGYGAFFEFGHANTVRSGMLYQIEISEYKSPKEEKQSDFFSTPFIFGKQNFFYPVKLGAQHEMLFGNKSNKNGVSLTGNIGGGLDLGLLRPYYVQMRSSGQYIKYESKDSSDFLKYSDIAAGPGFSKGWSDLKVVPGAYVKAALRFDYGSYNETLSALEIGLAGEFFSQKIPIMVHSPQKQFFFTGYVALVFGRRK